MKFNFQCTRILHNILYNHHPARNDNFRITFQYNIGDFEFQNPFCDYNVDYFD